MKINAVLLLIALAIAGLAGYGFFAANSGEEYCLVLTLGAGISLFITLSGVLAVSFEVKGGAGNIKVVSLLFFITLFVENLIFNFLPMKLPPYIIITTALLLVYILICYGITKALD